MSSSDNNYEIKEIEAWKDTEINLLINELREYNKFNF